MEEAMTRHAYKCPECGSRDIAWDASAVFDQDAQEMVLRASYDACYCDDCGEGIRAVEVDIDAEGKEIEP
jgi:transcription initiation factor TFIIIB Brf1 subunit/transcription initiation factor TFIIB